MTKLTYVSQFEDRPDLLTVVDVRHLHHESANVIRAVQLLQDGTRQVALGYILSVRKKCFI